MSPLKIGIVEDELVIARTIVSTLDELGYSHCGPAINYTEAMEMLEQERHVFLQHLRAFVFGVVVGGDGAVMRHGKIMMNDE